MKGWAIFVHSVRLVIRNREQALRIGLVPVVLTAAVLAVLVGGPGLAMMRMTGPGGAGGPMMDGGFALTALIGWLLVMLCMVWIVVNWHRFVLLEEYPHGWVPPFPFSLILGYFGRLLMLGVILVVLVSIPLGILVAAVGQGAIILLPIFWVIIMVGFYRSSVILPACAVGKPMKLAEAWNATRGATGVVLTLAVILFAVNYLLQLVVGAIMAISLLLGSLLMIAVSLFLGLVGVSVLTTLYGHYVEGRDID